MTYTKQYSPYFLQAQEWSDFWIGAVNSSHEKFYLEFKGDFATFSSYIYKYPWHLNQNFLYLPKGPIATIDNKDVSQSDLVSDFRKFYHKLIAFGLEHKATHLKLDFDDEVMKYFDVSSMERLQEFLYDVQDHNSTPNTPKFELLMNTKTVQYLKTMVLDTSSLQTRSKTVSPDAIRDFYDDNLDYWYGKSQNVRRYTKKSIDNSWQIQTQKNSETFDSFWSIYEATSIRQGFAIHSKDYFEKLFAENFTHTILLQDEYGTAMSTWLAVESGNSIVYLYGGNTQPAFKIYAQYMMHITALKLIVDKGIKYYDLGGYDETKGFGKFKKGYRGDIRTFLGPVDIILKPSKYSYTNKLVETGKNITKIFS